MMDNTTNNDTTTHHNAPGDTPADFTVSTRSSQRTLIGVIAVAALGLASAGIIASQLGTTDASLTGSLNGVPYALGQALDQAEASRASTEVIQLTSANAADAGGGADTDDSTTPTTDDVVDTVGDIASTVGSTLVEVGKCFLEQLPDVFSSGSDTAPGDAADVSACDDLLPDFGAIDVGVLDLSDIDLDNFDPADIGLPTDFDIGDLDLGDLGDFDLSDIDLDDFDPAEIGLPTDFDIGDLDLGDLGDFDLSDLGDYELPDLSDLDLDDLGLDFDADQVNLGTEALEVISDVADQVVEFFEELPSNVGERFDGLFGSD